MQEAVSPVVQVITSGPDWAAITAGIVTGVVDLAGIAGTLWSGNRNISAENERARNAEKRRIYANYIAALTSIISAMDTLVRNYENAAPEERAAMRADLDKAVVDSMPALSEVRSIVNPNLAGLAEDISHDLSRSAGRVRRGEGEMPQFGTMRERLYPAMRADLAEPG